MPFIAGNKMNHKTVCKSVLSSVLFLTVCAGQCLAQISVRENPSVRTTDRLNVDVTTGLPHWVIPDVGIGPDEIGLRHTVRSQQASFLMPRDDYRDSVILNQTGYACSIGWAGQSYLVSYNGLGECFYLQNGIFTSFDGKGSILEETQSEFLYTLSDGTEVTYSKFEGIYGFGLKRVRQPNGITTRVFYETNGSYRRVRSVEKNTGYRLYYKYGSDDPTQTDWHTFAGVIAYNAAAEACDSGVFCNFLQGWPSSSYVKTEDSTGITMSVIDEAGKATSFSTDSSYQFNNYGRFNKVKLPSSNSPEIIYKYCPFDQSCTIWQMTSSGVKYTTINDLVVSATQNGLTWSYGLSSAGPVNLQRNSTGPNGYVINLLTQNNGNLISLSTPKGGYTFSGGSGAQVRTATNTDGSAAGYIRDGRGNIVEVRRGDAVEQRASFPVTCVNRITCNRPASVTDANGNQTVFEYDPVHGGIVRATGPTVNGVTRETRYLYEARFPRYLNGAGAVVQDPDPVWVLTQESSCRVGPSSATGCVLPEDEERTVYERGPSHSTDGLLIRGIVKDAGGAVARTCYTYDRFGNQVSITTPAAQLSTCSQ